MKFKRLLAKSFEVTELKPKKLTREAKKARQFSTYLAHIALVMQSAMTIVDEIGTTILEQLNLDIDLERFKNTVKLGAYLHDWGKNNQHFQEMIYLKSIRENSEDKKLNEYRKKINSAWTNHHHKQMLRHEVISGILALEVDSFRQWLEQCEGIEKDDLIVAVWSAMGHHLKIGKDEYGKVVDYCIAQIPDGTGDGLNIYTSHQDFKQLLAMGKNFGLNFPGKLPEFTKEFWTREELEKALASLQKKFELFEQKYQNDLDFQKYIAAVKATVIVADLAGSALPNVGENIKYWLTQELNILLSEDGNELEKIIQKKLNGHELFEFQKEIANAKNRVTLVNAGCGNGKTLGAYAWAKNWAKGHKLFFCYPTTGTASQGFIDYANGIDIEANLMHSRADLDREILFSGDAGDSEGIDAKLSALQAWRKKLIVCTVDTVLGLIQNNRKPLYSWVALIQGAFVFDEVHAYDSRLFGALLTFIKTFKNAPILLMSASFTPEQLTAINDVMNELGEEINEPIKGAKELEKLPRYQLQYIEEENNVWNPILESLKKGEKVLWVTNSVQTCIDIYRSAKDQLQSLNLTPLIYHSRFRYQDRLAKHSALINAFQTDQPILAITTQVCEMSLDISADLLISALAPASALIQRLGRLNRRMKKTEEGAKIAIIYPWNNAQPYDSEELNTGKKLIDQLADQGNISQEDLAKIASQLNSLQPEVIKSNWLEGNWCTHPGFLREAGYTITVLLEDDLKTINQEKEKRKDKSFMKTAQAFTVPIRIPTNHKWQDWKRIKFYPVAPKDIIFYSDETGAEEITTKKKNTKKP